MTEDVARVGAVTISGSCSGGSCTMCVLYWVSLHILDGVVWARFQMKPLQYFMDINASRLHEEALLAQRIHGYGSAFTCLETSRYSYSKYHGIPYQIAQ